MCLGDPHFAIFAMQMMFGKGQQIGMTVHIQMGRECFMYNSSMGVMVVHQWGSMMMMDQRSRVVVVVIVVQVSVMQIMMGMMMLIDVSIVMDDVMIDHGISVVQEMMGFIVHHLVHMMHWLHFMDGLMANNLGRSMDMSVMYMVMAVHIVIQVSGVAIVMINWMLHRIQMMITTINHNRRAVSQMNTIRMMHIGINKMRQLLVMIMMIQMGQETGLCHAQQCQSADKDLKVILKVVKNILCIDILLDTYLHCGDFTLNLSLSKS